MRNINSLTLGIAATAYSGKDTMADLLVKLIADDLFVKAQKYNFALPIKEAVNSYFGWGDDEAYGKNKEVVLEGTLEINSGADRLLPQSLFDRGILKWVPEWNDLKFINLLRKRGHLTFLHKNNERMTDVFSYKISPRKAYQLYGTEHGRDYSDTIWVDLAPKEGIVIVPDVRFENEADYIRGLGKSVYDPVKKQYTESTLMQGKLVHLERPGAKSVEDHVSEAGVAYVTGDDYMLNDDTLLSYKQKIKDYYLSQIRPMLVGFELYGNK